MQSRHTAGHRPCRWRCGDPGEGQLSLEKQLAGLGVEGAEHAVIHRRTDEEDAAGGDNGAAVALRASVLHTLSGKVGVLTEGNFPEVLAGLEVDGVEGSPRRRDSGVAIGVKEFAVAGEVVPVCADE